MNVDIVWEKTFRIKKIYIIIRYNPIRKYVIALIALIY